MNVDNANLVTGLAHERTQDPRRVLRAGHLQRDQGDGEDDSGEREKGRRNGRQQRPRVVEIGREQTLEQREAARVPGGDVTAHPGRDCRNRRPRP
jgi:hypothetical protein